MFKAVAELPIKVRYWQMEKNEKCAKVREAPSVIGQKSLTVICNVI